MQLTYAALAAYLADCRRQKTHRLFVLGHPAPDGDAVLSSLFEGWRLTLGGTPAVPVAQADALPREVAWLLEDLAPLMLTAGEVDMSHTDCRFVLTDHHHDPVRQAQVTGVVDHHIPAPDTDLAGVDTHIAPVGATVTLVTQRLRRKGYTFDAGVARLLLGGILLDTDGLSPHKAKAEDREEAARLSLLCGEQPSLFYDRLQRELLAETDVPTLYRRDYRTYYGPDGQPQTGFAILKVWADARPDLGAVRRLLAADLAASGYALCIAKVMTFTPTGRGEQIYLAAGRLAEPFLLRLVETEGYGAVRTAPDQVVLSAACPQRGRKWYVTHLLPDLEQSE